MPQDSSNQTVSDQIAANARQWAGKDFKPGETERCQDFVNTVLNTTRPGLADQIGTTGQAKDGLESGQYLASRFFGNDKSTLFNDMSRARPGDLVAFNNTYGDYPPGTITHVGIYVGDGMIVDRSTSSKPVNLRSINTFGEGNYTFARPHVIEQMQSQNVANPAPSAPSTPSAPSASPNPAAPRQAASSDFGAQLRSNDLSKTPIYLAIGLAEGTIGRDGRPTSAYNGHQDPGNNVLNKGFGSYQVYQDPRGASLTAQQADRIQADRLAEQWPKIDAALTKAGFQPGATRDLVAANALDAWNQAPATQGGRYGVLNDQQLANLKQSIDRGASPTSAITQWRAESYKEDNGVLNAPGLGNTMDGVLRDQGRRVAAVNDGLQLRPAQNTSIGGNQPSPPAAPTSPTPPATTADRVWPVPGQYTINQSDKSFSEGEGQFGTNRGSNRHAGIDIQGNIGDPVVAMKAGRVVYAGNSLDPNGYGNSVLIDHGNGLATFYAHLSAINVKEGQQVTANQQIGKLGADGNARALVESGRGDPHLHFETIEGFNPNNLNSGNPVNPNKYLDSTARGGVPVSGSPVAAPASPSGQLLLEGDQGSQVTQLQDRLNKLGYKDSQGRPLATDGDFGPNTKFAVESLQRSAGILVDGKAGDDTFAAMRRAEAAQLANRPTPENPAQANRPENPAQANRPGSANLLSNPNHPDHAMYARTDALLANLPAGVFKNDRERQNAAGSLTYEARMSGMTSIDGVLLSSDQSKLLATQGDPKTTGERVVTDRAQAVTQSLLQSSELLATKDNFGTVGAAVLPPAPVSEQQTASAKPAEQDAKRDSQTIASR
jgi:murein DD-endopeptidase MepM/ murein hydrolase activator NlpD